MIESRSLTGGEEWPANRLLRDAFPLSGRHLALFFELVPLPAPLGLRCARLVDAELGLASTESLPTVTIGKIVFCWCKFG